MELHYIYHVVSIVQSLILPYIADDKLYEYTSYIFYWHVFYYLIDTIKEYLKNNSNSQMYIYHHIISATGYFITLYNVHNYDRNTIQNGFELVTWVDVGSYIVNMREDYIRDGKINLNNDFIFLLVYTYCRAYKFVYYLYFFYKYPVLCFFMSIIYFMSMIWLSIWYYKYTIRFLKKHHYFVGLY